MDKIQQIKKAFKDEGITCDEAIYQTDYNEPELLKKIWNIIYEK